MISQSAATQSVNISRPVALKLCRGNEGTIAARPHDVYHRDQWNHSKRTPPRIIRECARAPVASPYRIREWMIARFVVAVHLYARRAKKKMIISSPHKKSHENQNDVFDALQRRRAPLWFGRLRTQSVPRGRPRVRVSPLHVPRHQPSLGRAPVVGRRNTSDVTSAMMVARSDCGPVVPKQFSSEMEKA